MYSCTSDVHSQTRPYFTGFRDRSPAEVADRADADSPTEAVCPHPEAARRHSAPTQRRRPPIFESRSAIEASISL